MIFLRICCKEKSPSKYYKQARSPSMCKKEWKGFGCLRVSTAAVIVGLWHLAVHLLGFCIFISAFYLDYCNKSFYAVNSEVSPVNREKIAHSNIKYWTFTSFISLIATLALIYGTLSKKSVFVVPFLAFQFLDLIFDFFVLIIYIGVSSSFNDFISQLRHPPFQSFRVRYGEYYKTWFVISFVVVSFMIKVYLAKIVFHCYQFLLTLEKPMYKRDSVVSVRTDEIRNRSQEQTRINF